MIDFNELGEALRPSYTVGYKDARIEALMKRVSDLEAENERLRLKIQEKDE